jgi:hypothetical protein
MVGLLMARGARSTTAIIAEQHIVIGRNISRLEP